LDLTKIETKFHFTEPVSKTRLRIGLRNSLMNVLACAMTRIASLGILAGTTDASEAFSYAGDNFSGTL
jgi:hypothetical protein